MEHLFQQVPILSVHNTHSQKTKGPLHSYRDVPTFANDAHALGPPVLRRGRSFCNQSLQEDVQGIGFLQGLENGTHMAA